MQNPIIFSSVQKPIALASRDYTIEGSRGMTSGWGKTNVNSGTATHLLWIPVNVLNRSQCLAAHPKNQWGGAFTNPNHVCTFEGKGKGACQVSVSPYLMLDAFEKDYVYVQMSSLKNKNEFNESLMKNVQFFRVTAAVLSWSIMNSLVSPLGLRPAPWVLLMYSLVSSPTRAGFSKLKIRADHSNNYSRPAIYTPDITYNSQLPRVKHVGDIIDISHNNDIKV